MATAYDPYNAREPQADKPKRRSKKAPAPGVTVSVDGGPAVEMGSPEAADLLESTIKRKLERNGEKPMAERGNHEMFGAEERGEAAAQTVAAGQLRAFVERVERLEEDKQAVADDIKEVYAEMKGTGFDTKAVRTIVRLRKKDQAERQEEEAMVDLYKSALGMA